MRLVTLKAAAGVRNDVPPERFTSKDLVSGVNIDIDETGKIRRRYGIRPVVTGADVHSLWSDTSRAFFVDGGTLHELNADFSTTPMKSGLAPSRRMAYCQAANKIFMSNGVDAFYINRDNEVVPLGVEIPQPPVLNTCPGNLPAGAYGVTLTYVRRDGTESGAPGSVFIDVPANSGITISDIPVSSDPFVETKRLYCTTPNGEVAYLIMELANSVTNAVYSSPSDYSVACLTQFKGPLPPGDILGYYNGRLYSIAGSVVWYSDPYNYELCDYRENYIQLEARGTIFAPVTDGVFIGSDLDTIFLQGGDPGEFRRTQVSPAPSIFGTLVYVNNRFATEQGLYGMVAMWMTAKGACLGASGGQFVEMTSDRFVMPDVSDGAGLFRLNSGTAHYLAALN